MEEKSNNDRKFSFEGEPGGPEGNGVRAGVAAGMNVIAVATPFTVAGLHSSEVLEHAWVVHEGDNLLDVVKERIANHNRSAH